MSIISANTLFHFTPSKENLLSILETGFRPSYSPEFGDSTNGRLNECEIPMVCFCDLPISSLDKHIGLAGKKGYGKYGLGMTKEWGIENKLNPVTYVTNDSYHIEASLEANNKLHLLFDYYRGELGKIFTNAHKNKTSFTNEENIIVTTCEYLRSAYEASNLTMNHLKPYQNAINGFRYYDEREWRYVVPYNEDNNYEVPVLWPKQFPKQLESKSAFKAVISQKYMLKFDAIDIKYLILENDTSVSDVIEKMESLPDKFTREDIDRLISRIITCEQIEEDF